jgi:hypothetical protein
MTTDDRKAEQRSHLLARMVWTDDDERRARELLAAACAVVPAGPFSEAGLLEDGWEPALAALIAAATDLLERALDEIERLRKAQSELEAECGSLEAHAFADNAEAESAHGRIATLEAALRRYGQHESWDRCRTEGCTCGLDAALGEGDSDGE